MENDKIEELANEVKKCQSKLDNAKHALFVTYKSTLVLRIEQICRQLIRGRVEPICSSDELSIPLAIAKDGLKENKYPCSEIKWKVDGSNIRASIVAVFRGEVDTSYDFEFPISTASFEKYLEELTKEADIRHSKKLEAKKEVRSKEEAMERSQLKYLINKYPDEVSLM